jgi:hypothetical protein
MDVDLRWHDGNYPDNGLWMLTYVGMTGIVWTTVGTTTIVIPAKAGIHLTRYQALRLQKNS